MLEQKAAPKEGYSLSVAESSITRMSLHVPVVHITNEGSMSRRGVSPYLRDGLRAAGTQDDRLLMVNGKAQHWDFWNVDGHRSLLHRVMGRLIGLHGFGEIESS